MASSKTQNMWMTMEKEDQGMMAVWPDVVRDITEMVTDLNIPDVDKWLEKVLHYNVPTTKKILGLSLIYIYKSLVPKEQQTEDNIRLVQILAWCAEMALSNLVMIDDIMDRSSFRRGQPCWYRYNNIGLMAINDGLLLESVVYYLIKKHFKGKECYINLLETYQDAIFKTQLGQSLDMYMIKCNKKPNDLINLDLFTMNRCRLLVTYKAYLIVVPIFAAMHFVGIKDPEMFKEAKNIALDIGYLIQARDDYLACYGSYETIQKISTDIEEGKCSWVVVTALERVTPEQRKILEECYGVSDPEKVKRVKQLFADLDLPNIYSKHEKETYNQINEQIQQLSCGLLRNYFFDFLEKICQREECCF
ncbi:farnesyl pyrophosphate synthase-like [Monomorium pharaonis]|uniref:farnesyl pyrophosphate synthase-like n=1 Tax=Monomorium pharaonis TaxID=307658 RepID=UPI001745F25D|nr:farnesyl pyrophosphate synthase-like [Monomorium pharaonis]XP_036147446.1 farnesyl pyrophosphate synthase-like [Monomorium pharaonis]XP_036147447.1 farnesyl pyrophosphate synthase-like [Monomorium pharaonis]XP_036147448.1 farnesyl pyrophosphate synthase-like [Monomorium pharaonis]